MTPEERAEWLEWRRGGLGGSEVAAIMGISPWANQWSVWASKVHGADTGDNRAMVIGRWLEPVIVAWTADRLGVTWTPGSPHAAGEDSWMRATPDAWLNTPYRLGLEVKTARQPGQKWGDDGSDAIPDYYRTQVAWYMAVFDVESWAVAVFFLRSYERRLYFVERDRAFESTMIGTCRAWWERHIIGGEIPKPDESADSRRALLLEHPSDHKRAREAEPGEVGLMEALWHAERCLDEQTKHRDRLRNQLRRAIGDHSGIYGRGIRCTWKRPSGRLRVMKDD